MSYTTLIKSFIYIVICMFSTTCLATTIYKMTQDDGTIVYADHPLQSSKSMKIIDLESKTSQQVPKAQIKTSAIAAPESKEMKAHAVKSKKKNIILAKANNRVPLQEVIRCKNRLLEMTNFKNCTLLGKLELQDYCVFNHQEFIHDIENLSAKLCNENSNTNDKEIAAAIASIGMKNFKRGG